METHQLIREKNPDAIMQAQGRIKNLNEKIEKIQKQEMEINKEIKDLSNIGVSSKPGQSSEILNSDDIIKAGIGGSLITFID
jgi:cell division protein FtsL